MDTALPPTPKKGWFSLSPLNKRRWTNFTRNRRAYWSLWIFLVLFVLSLRSAVFDRVGWGRGLFLRT